MSTISQVTLRRLAARALRVLERHKDREPAVGALVGSLDVDAKAFIAAYDAVMGGAPGRKMGRMSGDEQLDALVRKLRMWLALMAKDIPKFRRSDYLQSYTVPDDVISSAETILEAVESYNGSAKEPLAYTEQLTTDIETALGELRATVGSHNDGRAAFSELLETARTEAENFHQELIALRRTLEASVGRQHPDYRLIRNPAWSSGEAETDEIMDDLEEAAGISGAELSLAEEGGASSEEPSESPAGEDETAAAE